MVNDYSNFFSTYNSVEPPKYTKFKLDNYFKEQKLKIKNPYFYSKASSNNPVLSFVFNLEDQESNTPDIIYEFNTPRLEINGDVFNVLANKNRRSIASEVTNALNTEMNWNNMLISAFLGNVMQESSFDIGAQNPNSSAHGLLQMTNSTYNAFKKWDDRHPEYKNKYPEYVRQALYAADSFNRKDGSVIMSESREGINLKELNRLGWEDWESNDLDRMSRAVKRMFFRSGEEDKTEDKRAEYTHQIYDIITKGGYA